MNLLEKCPISWVTLKNLHQKKSPIPSWKFLKAEACGCSISLALKQKEPDVLKTIKYGKDDNHAVDFTDIDMMEKIDYDWEREQFENTEQIRLY